MDEVDVEHVRVLHRGSLRYAEGKHRDGALRPQLCHSNRYGVTIVVIPNGLGVVRSTTLDAAANASVEKMDSKMDADVNLVVDATLQFPTTPLQVALSPSERLVAVAMACSVAIYDIADLLENANAAESRACALGSDIHVVDVSWCASLDDDKFLAVLTSDQSFHILDSQARTLCRHSSLRATSLSWCSTGRPLLAVGDIAGDVHKLHFTGESFQSMQTLIDPNKPVNASVHHLHWAEENLLLAGYKMGSFDAVEISGCLFDHDCAIALDAVVDFFPSETRDHAFFSCYLAPWRTFIVGCSVSPDLELVVHDPESQTWQKWKPDEKYTPRLPMAKDDEETFPMGLCLHLNASDSDAASVFPRILCASMDGLLLNFALVDLTLDEPIDFLVATESLPRKQQQPVSSITAADNSEQERKEEVESHEDAANRQNLPVSTATNAADIGIPASHFEACLWIWINDFHDMLQKTFELKTGENPAVEPIAMTRRIEKAVDSMRSVLDKTAHDMQTLVQDQISTERTIESISTMKTQQPQDELDDGPLDKRALDTHKALASSMETISRLCESVDFHSKALAVQNAATEASCPSLLFRLLKANYERTKRQHLRLCRLDAQFHPIQPTQKPPAIFPSSAFQDEDGARRQLKEQLTKWTDAAVTPRQISSQI
ncbi:unnamed protein product [Aphanomyces euteiches]|uniref:Nucleoporin Nup159/Nup146 N-terminal domain-containing protein n=1 Tax=Aphanomyces euteiches TaxID=100861 RepID=A0A6G0XNP4_9STRA|nr:hypothetical protein Ae201684_002784 [Aphanomyces euteiches]KAH9092930.1 hypothetical protein Ae201684P_008596 [Aphanomyces euteiches]KAH9157158.1 hypothetical protein AeRB84_000972 [Aphanomyces euteiches]